MNTTKCAIYIRVSTEMQARQQSSTLDSQTKYCKKFLSLHPDWVLTDVYREEGVSGTTLNRPQFQRLLSDVKQKKFDLLLVNDIDRLGRNLKDFLNVWQIFDENQVKFISINQNLDTTSIMGKALIQLLMVFAELESNMTKQRTTQKRRYDVVEKGRWIGGRIPVGYDYDKETKKLSVNEKDASFVRLVFKLYLQYESVYKVADELNIKGFKTKSFTTKGEPKGNLPINSNYIDRILKSKLYAGYVGYKGVWHQGTHPAIITENTYDKAQASLAHNRGTHKTEKRKHSYLFDGKVRCSECNYSMTPGSGTGRHGKVYRYYVCLSKSKAPKQHFCRHAQIPAEILEEVVDWTLKQLATDKKLLSSKIIHFNYQINSVNNELNAKAESIRKQDAEMRIEYEGLYKVLSEKRLRNFEKVDERLRVLKITEAENKNSLEDIEVKIQNNSRMLFNGTGLRFYLNYYKFNSKGMKFEPRRRLLRGLIDRIEYKGDEIEIKLRDVKTPEKPEAGNPHSNLFAGSSGNPSWVLSATDSESESKVTVRTKFSLKFEKSESNGGKLLRGKVLDLASLKLINDVPETAVLKFPGARVK